MVKLIHFPELETWGQQLTNILPLAALLEFVDVEKKLHMLELSGFRPMWDWPLTPAGVRLLLSEEDTTDGCCLDRDNRTATLHCMDGKYGNSYPSSAPATIRLLAKGFQNQKRVENPRLKSAGKKFRKQTLQLFVVQERAMKPHKIHLINKLYGTTSLRYVAIGALHLALGYLLLMPLTALSVTLRFGSKLRGLMGMQEPKNLDRLGIATNSFNGSEWWAFYGPKNSINGLLNRPLLRTEQPQRDILACWAIRVSAALQWTLAIASCARQSWDAFMITLWITFCALFMTYLYPPETGAVDWLRYICGLEITRIKAVFTSRRSLLSSLILLNPDRDTTEWLDPILSKTHQERKSWETAVHHYIETRTNSEKDLGEYWYDFVLEGVSMGDNIRDSVIRYQQRYKNA